MTLEMEVQGKIRPDDALRKEVESVSTSLLKAVRKLSSSFDAVSDVRLVGSVSKDTYVGRPDIDVFILFKVGTDRKEMDEIGLRIGSEVLVDREQRYAEHPYTHGRFDGYQADIVPCYHIEDTSKLMSAVDRTPFHTEYVIKNLRQDQRDEVRLLKQFLKGIAAYGAEAKTQGFSGYLVELLVLKYGSFTDVIKAASSWRTGLKLGLDAKGERRFQSPLTFYDPVDPSRNVASALSLERFSMFVHACKEYQREPRMTFFFPNPRIAYTIGQVAGSLDGLGFDAVSVKCIAPDLIDDNLYPQARKTLEGLGVQLAKDDFIIVDQSISISDGEVHLAFLLESIRLCIAKKHIGPPVTMGNSEDFLARWKGEALLGPYIENGRWVVLVKREFTNAIESVRKGVYVASLGDSFKKTSFEVNDSRKVTSSGALMCLTTLLDKRMSWDV